MTVSLTFPTNIFQMKYSSWIFIILLSTLENDASSFNCVLLYCALVPVLSTFILSGLERVVRSFHNIFVVQNCLFVNLLEVWKEIYQQDFDQIRIGLKLDCIC